MSMFDGIQAAKVNLSRYIKSGHYLARIDAVVAGQNRSGGDLVAIEMTNLFTFPDGPVPLDGKFHAVGEALSEVISKSGSKDMYLPRIKAFAMSVLNATDEEITSEVCEQVTGPTQPLKGLVIEVYATNIVTKLKQQQIVRVEWRGQIGVARLKQLVPADQLLRNGLDAAALTALAARQVQMGVN